MTAETVARPLPKIRIVPGVAPLGGAGPVPRLDNLCVEGGYLVRRDGRRPNRPTALSDRAQEIWALVRNARGESVPVETQDGFHVVDLNKGLVESSAGVIIVKSSATSVGLFRLPGVFDVGTARWNPAWRLFKGLNGEVYGPTLRQIMALQSMHEGTLSESDVAQIADLYGALMKRGMSLEVVGDEKILSIPGARLDLVRHVAVPDDFRASVYMPPMLESAMRTIFADKLKGLSWIDDGNGPSAVDISVAVDGHADKDRGRALARRARSLIKDVADPRLQIASSTFRGFRPTYSADFETSELLGDGETLSVLFLDGSSERLSPKMYELLCLGFVRNRLLPPFMADELLRVDRSAHIELVELNALLERHGHSRGLARWPDGSLEAVPITLATDRSRNRLLSNRLDTITPVDGMPEVALKSLNDVEIVFDHGRNVLTRADFTGELELLPSIGPQAAACFRLLQRAGDGRWRTYSRDDETEQALINEVDRSLYAINSGIFAQFQPGLGSRVVSVPATSVGAGEYRPEFRSIETTGPEGARRVRLSAEQALAVRMAAGIVTKDKLGLPVLEAFKGTIAGVPVEGYPRSRQFKVDDELSTPISPPSYAVLHMAATGWVTQKMVAAVYAISSGQTFQATTRAMQPLVDELTRLGLPAGTVETHIRPWTREGARGFDHLRGGLTGHRSTRTVFRDGIATEVPEVDYEILLRLADRLRVDFEHWSTDPDADPISENEFENSIARIESLLQDTPLHLVKSLHSGRVSAVTAHSMDTHLFKSDPRTLTISSDSATLKLSVVAYMLLDQLLKNGQADRVHWGRTKHAPAIGQRKFDRAVVEIVGAVTALDVETDAIDGLPALLSAAELRQSNRPSRTGIEIESFGAESESGQFPMTL